MFAKIALLGLQARCQRLCLQQSRTKSAALPDPPTRSHAADEIDRPDGCCSVLALSESGSAVGYLRGDERK